MTKQEISDTFEKIAKYLEEKRLKETFDILAETLTKHPNWQVKEKLNDLEDTYKQMLAYISNGIADPEREHVLNDLRRSIYHLSDIFEFDLKQNSTFSYFYELKQEQLMAHSEAIEIMIDQLNKEVDRIKLLNFIEEENEKKEDLKFKEYIINKIFDITLLSAHWNNDNRKTWSEILKNKDYPVVLQCLIITGLTINLLETFDEQKALLLFESAENINEEIKLRSLTGIILFLHKYNNRLHLYPSILNRLNNLAEDKEFIKNICQILIQFIFCRETEKITRKMTDEIFPEMLKITSKLNTNILSDDSSNEAGMEDKNPEWIDCVKKSEIDKKWQEISELHLEGADVMYSSFIHLKSYNFFNILGNWFIPFHFRSDFMEDKEMVNLAKILSESTMICNSDKYSLLLSFYNMPEKYRKMTLRQFSTEIEYEKKVFDLELKLDTAKKINAITRQYIQDLYRFFKAHPKKKDFKDIFEPEPEYYRIPSIFNLIRDKENLSVICEFYFNKNYFKEAADIYDLLITEEPGNNALYQKKGYCMQMQGDIKNALDAYLKAELLNANDPWIIKKLAACYRLLKQPENALAYYKKAEQLNPNNLSLQLNIGHCYLELKNYSEALKYYFKVEYLDENKQKTMRPIAWCSFLNGKFRQAEDYYKKIIEENPDSTDYLNAGHTQLATGNYEEAIRLYGLSLKCPNNSVEKFMKSFRNDIPDIVHAGIKKEDIPYIMDQILYDM
ncbi:MAG: tetratricopeptide repeat protein [Dysgonamonadaceae bacterium]|jgi:tetratricopeptide (TPR) repeat protein|nr:tetratricopeptide repeat protein [Dysgonamonadaceae bacterium]